MTEAVSPEQWMTPPRYECRTVKGQRIWVRSDVRPDQLDLLLRHPGQPLKESPRGTVTRVGTWVVKRQSAGSLAAGIKLVMRPERNRQAWMAAHYLRHRGVRVPEPLAYVEFRNTLGITTGTAYISQFLDGFLDIEDFLFELIRRGAGEATLREFLDGIARACLALEQAPAWHSDLAGKNIFTRDGRLFYFIDLEAVRIGSPPTEEERLKNHVQLYDSLCDAMGDALLVPFIEKMLPQGTDIRIWMPQVRKLQQKRRAEVEARWEREGVHPRHLRHKLEELYREQEPPEGRNRP
ncbi:MAG TPA: lipopolysaccharide kinase InaA family protein [Candidatus Hydrogenedentes bacterium]|nr:lipopolysaccharide kinase InaA family protein [Candidatus Hydrogenedentota bacterium]